MEVWRWAAAMSDSDSTSSLNPDSDDSEVIESEAESHFEWSLKDHLSDVTGRASPIIGG